MTRKALLVCGILSSVLYVAISILVAAQAEGYSSVSQTVSELSAIDAPTRPLWMPLIAVYGLLLIAFGYGVWLSGRRSRALRIAGALVIAHGVLGFFWPPMHLRPVLAAGGGTLSDTLHIAWTFVTVVLMMLSIGFAAVAFGRRFRVYSTATIVLLVAFGALTGTYAPSIQANLPTPLVGVWERIDISFFLLWVVVLAGSLLRLQDGDRAMSRPRSAFKTPEGETAFLAAYDAAMKLWPVPYDELGVPSRFGVTHVIVSGPKDAPPLVLLHGYWATSTMWAPNIADFSKDYRVYAIDVMGQPSKTIPNEPVRNASDYVEWLSATLDALHLRRIPLAGMSFGGWLALNYAVAAPTRVRTLVLLSPGGFLPMVRQFSLRGMLMVFVPTRFTVNSFMRWLGFTATNARVVLELMYLGLKHFRVPPETARVMPTVFSDDELRVMRVPTLLLIGDHEVISNPAKALARARQLIPDFHGDLVPRSSHDMCISQHRIVDARVLDFLTDSRGRTSERVVA